MNLQCRYKTEDGYCQLHSDAMVREYCVEGPCDDEKIECCGNCEYWAEKYSICEHPDCPQGIADFVCADRDACELWESAT